MDDKELAEIERRLSVGHEYSPPRLSKQDVAWLIAEVRRLKEDNRELVKRLAWASSHPNKPYKPAEETGVSKNMVRPVSPPRPKQ